MTKRELMDAIADVADEATVYIDMGNGFLRSSVDVYIDGDEEDIVLAITEEAE